MKAMERLHRRTVEPHCELRVIRKVMDSWYYVKYGKARLLVLFYSCSLSKKESSWRYSGRHLGGWVERGDMASMTPCVHHWLCE